MIWFSWFDPTHPTATVQLKTADPSFRNVPPSWRLKSKHARLQSRSEARDSTGGAGQRRVDLGHAHMAGNFDPATWTEPPLIRFSLHEDPLSTPFFSLRAFNTPPPTPTEGKQFVLIMLSGLKCVQQLWADYYSAAVRPLEEALCCPHSSELHAGSKSEPSSRGWVVVLQDGGALRNNGPLSVTRTLGGVSQAERGERTTRVWKGAEEEGLGHAHHSRHLRKAVERWDVKICFYLQKMFSFLNHGGQTGREGLTGDGRQEHNEVRCQTSWTR